MTFAPSAEQATAPQDATGAAVGIQLPPESVEIQTQSPSDASVAAKNTCPLAEHAREVTIPPGPVMAQVPPQLVETATRLP